MVKSVRILSLDGGGVRGLSSLYILKDLMDHIALRHRVNNPQSADISQRPCDYFDLICGTSTGGLIALMLGRLDMVTAYSTIRQLTSRLSMRQLKSTKHCRRQFLKANPKIRGLFLMKKSSSMKSGSSSRVLDYMLMNK